MNNIFSLAIMFKTEINEYHIKWYSLIKKAKLKKYIKNFIDDVYIIIMNITISVDLLLSFKNLLLSCDNSYCKLINNSDIGVSTIQFFDKLEITIYKNDSIIIRYIHMDNMIYNAEVHNIIKNDDTSRPELIHIISIIRIAMFKTVENYITNKGEKNHV